MVAPSQRTKELHCGPFDILELRCDECVLEIILFKQDVLVESGPSGRRLNIVRGHKHGIPNLNGFMALTRLP